MTPSTRLSVSLLLIAVVWPICAAGQQVNPQVAGQWVMTTDVFGNPLHQTLTLKLEGTAVSGTLYDGDRTEISGTLNGNVIRFATKEEHAGAPSEYEGTIAGDEMSGNARVFGDRPDERLPVKWTARRIPPAPSGPPRRHEFVPTVFHRAFSAYNAPVLHIKSGDTVHTATVDAGGFDDKGVPRVLGGNPETGPFYVDGALPGDTLIVRLLQVRLNRDWASSDDALVPRALSAGIAEPMRYEPKGVRWKLDRERNLAAPAEPSEHLKKYVVPVKPMLGCVATAPGFASQPVSAGDSGRWGGNMDFNEVGEGATVHLPVNQPGALLYVGDGHALQGDGELNGNALETSMDVEFTVELVKEQSINGPRVENADHIMTVGLAGSLDDAFREATGAMAQWLTDEYKLTASETAQVLGTSVEYKIAEVADRNAGVVAKIKRERLVALK